MHVCILLGNSFEQLVSPRLSLSKMVQFVQCHCIQAHLSVKHLGFHSQINHVVERAESIRMCFFCARNTSDMEFQLGQILSNLGSNVVRLHLFSKVSRRI